MTDHITDAVVAGLEAAINEEQLETYKKELKHLREYLGPERDISIPLGLCTLFTEEVPTFLKDTIEYKRIQASAKIIRQNPENKRLKELLYTAAQEFCDKHNYQPTLTL